MPDEDNGLRFVKIVVVAMITVGLPIVFFASPVGPPTGDRQANDVESKSRNLSRQEVLRQSLSTESCVQRYTLG